MTDAIDLKNWKCQQLSDLDLKLLKLCAKTKCKENLGLKMIVDTLHQVVLSLHCMQVSVTVDRSEQCELEQVVSGFRKKFQTQHPGLFEIYRRETRGWRRLANIKKQQDITTQFDKIKFAVDALELALQLSSNLASYHPNALGSQEFFLASGKLDVKFIVRPLRRRTMCYQ